MSWGAKVPSIDIDGLTLKAGDTISNGRQRHQVTNIITAWGRSTVLVLTGPDVPLLTEEEFLAGGWRVVAPTDFA